MRCTSFMLLVVSIAASLAAVPLRAADDGRAAASGARSASTSQAIYVAITGDDSNSGDSPDQSLKSPAAAVAKAAAGTIVYFAAGTYPSLKIVDKHGTATAPIVFRPLAGQERQATFSSGKLDAGIAVLVEKCSYVELRGLRAADSQKGFDLQSVTHVVLEGSSAENIGQEAIHVGRKHTYDGTNQFLAPASENVRIAGNVVRGTGKAAATYGEGIYVGTGAFPGDDTHAVVVEGNTLTDIAAEAVEVKPGTYDVAVRRNVISDTHHEYNGAITVAVEGTPTQDGKFVIEDNLIWNIKKIKHSVAGIAIGHGNAVIRNNIIWEVDGGVGINVYAVFANPQALGVTIANNTIICSEGDKPRILLHESTAGREPSMLRADVKVLKTFTNDGSAGSTPAQPGLFVGPFTGDADGGKGPGSGFRLKRYAGIGADYTKIASAPPARTTTPRK